MKVMLTAALLASISLAPAFAADTPSKPADAKPADAKPAAEQKLICTKEAAVGSIIPKKVCRTPEQVEAERRAAREINDDRSRLGGRPDLVSR
jgi:hypothetical protein